jgi:hypothetical protein
LTSSRSSALLFSFQLFCDCGHGME